MFDPYDWENFFFGAMGRDEACRLLAAAPIGSFLLRESHSRLGGFSLSVRECADGDHQIYHYFIEKKEVEKDKFRFEMCNNVFVDIPSLITHYQMHTLEKCCLRKPLSKQALCRVIARYKFDGERVSDLPFERGEVLDVIDKTEEGWWVARNALNITGLIPVPYVKLYEEGDEISLLNPSTNSSSNGSVIGGKRFSANSLTSEQSCSSNSQQQQQSSSHNVQSQQQDHHLQTSSQQQTNGCVAGNEQKRFSSSSVAASVASGTTHVPAWVRVIADRFPSIYDANALPIRQGQMLYIMEVLPTGMCRGQMEMSGRVGFFPFSYVEWTNIPLDAGPWTPPNA